MSPQTWKPMALFGPLTNRFFPPTSPEITIVSRVQGQRQTTSEPCEPFPCLLRLLADRRRTSPTNRELLSECLIPRSPAPRRPRWKGALKGPGRGVGWEAGWGVWGSWALSSKTRGGSQTAHDPSFPVRRRHLLGRDSRAGSIRSCCRPPPVQIPRHRIALAKRPVHKMPLARAQGDIYVYILKNTCTLHIYSCVCVWESI